MLTKVDGGWTVWPDPATEVQKKYTIVAIKYGYYWSKLGEPITFKAGETVSIYL